MTGREVEGELKEIGRRVAGVGWESVSEKRGSKGEMPGVGLHVEERENQLKEIATRGRWEVATGNVFRGNR